MEPLDHDDHAHLDAIVAHAANVLKSAHYLYAKRKLDNRALTELARIRDRMRMLQAHFLDGQGYGQLPNDELVVMGRLEELAANLLVAEAAA